MIKLRLDDRYYEISQQGMDGNINVDVTDLEGNVEYTFDLEHMDLLEFLEEFQRNNNII